MKSREATALAERLADAWPGKATQGTLNVFADRLAAWDLDPASRAVERLIDGCRYFPSVVELREAYGAEGGSLPDAGRRMSPPVPAALGPVDEAEVARLRSTLRQRLCGRVGSGRREGAG